MFSGHFLVPELGIWIHELILFSHHFVQQHQGQSANLTIFVRFTIMFESIIYIVAQLLTSSKCLICACLLTNHAMNFQCSLYYWIELLASLNLIWLESLFQKSQNQFGKLTLKICISTTTFSTEIAVLIRVLQGNKTNSVCVCVRVDSIYLENTENYIHQLYDLVTPFIDIHPRKKKHIPIQRLVHKYTAKKTSFICNGQKLETT